MKTNNFWRFSFLLFFIAAIFFLLTRLPVKVSKAYLASSTTTKTIPDEAPQTLANLQEAFRSIAERVQPAVVNISSFHEEAYQAPEQFYFMDPEEFFYEFFHGVPRQKKPRVFKRQHSGTGSGVIIDERGHVLTNAHVVAQAQEIKVRVTTKKEKKTYKAKVVGQDERLDLALLQIDANGPFPFVLLGDSNETRVGDWAIAIGSPFELEQTFTVGVISAIRQSLPIQERTYHNLIQTDAAINRGNSGGPLVNIKGEAIGINTAIFSPSGVFAGIGFSIPINSAKEILEDLKLGREKQWGWLGVSVAEVDEVVAKQFKLPEPQGALINEVFKDSPGQRAGLTRGDAIVRLNGESIKNPTDLTNKVRHIEPGKKAKISLIRDGKNLEMDLTIAARPKWADIKGLSQEEAVVPPQEKTSPQEDFFEWQKMTVKIDKDQREGVIVASLNPKSPLAYYLEEGDVILGINRMPIKDIADFKKATRGASLKEGIVFDILRRGSFQFVSVQTQ